MTDYAISPDNQTVTYLVGDASSLNELWLESMSGQAYHRIASNVQTSRINDSFQLFTFTQDGHRLVYRTASAPGANQIATGLGVYLVGSIDPGYSITPAIESCTTIAAYAVSADGLWAYYIADAEVDEQYELYRASLVSGDNTNLNLPLVAVGDVATCALSPYDN